MATFKIPTPTLLPEPSLVALRLFAESQSVSTDEEGEFFAHSVALKVATNEIVADSIIIVPLVAPIDGQEADFTYLAATPFCFVQLNGRPQELMTYGICLSASEGAEDIQLPIGLLVKFPTPPAFIVAKQTFGITADTLASYSTTANKRLCTRQPELGGELADSDKGTLRFILDLDGGRHYTRNKTELAVREKELCFIFRAMDKDRWEYAMGTDFNLQTEDYRCMIIEQGKTRAEHRNPAFGTCGLLDRIQGLSIVRTTEALKSFLTGNVLVEGSAFTIRLDDFITGEDISGGDSVCSEQNRPMVAVLRTIQTTLQTFLSESYNGALDPFVAELEGAKRPFELVPADFLKYSVEWALRKFFRVIRTERGVLHPEESFSNPHGCAIFLRQIFTSLSESLADHQSRAVEEAYFRMRLVRDASLTPIIPEPLVTQKTPGKRVKSSKVTAVPAKPKTKPCVGHLGAQLKATFPDGKPYRCHYGKLCAYRHALYKGKTESEMFEIIQTLPLSAQEDLRKMVTSRPPSIPPGK